MEINPEYLDAKKKLGLLHFRKSEPVKAESMIREALELHQDYADLHKILGDILLTKGDYHGASEAYQASLDVNDHFTEAALGLVISLRREGSGDQADNILNNFINKNPDNLLARAFMTHDKAGLDDI